MAWRGTAAIAMVLAAAGCGGATTSSQGGPADGGADQQAPEASTDGNADAADAQELCGTKTCGAEQLCHWYDSSCGALSYDTGKCQAQSAACDATRPVCGCDGKVYASECAAHAAGLDTLFGGCPAPAGWFKCGDRFCRVGDEYCYQVSGDTGDRSGRCHPRPACDSGTLCDCISGSGCFQCNDDGQGRVTEICSM